MSRNLQQYVIILLYFTSVLQLLFQIYSTMLPVPSLL